MKQSHNFAKLKELSRLYLQASSIGKIDKAITDECNATEAALLKTLAPAEKHQYLIESVAHTLEKDKADVISMLDEELDNNQDDTLRATFLLGIIKGYNSGMDDSIYVIGNAMKNARQESGILSAEEQTARLRAILDPCNGP